MAITDELREYARHLHNVWYDPQCNVYTYTTMDNAPSLDAVRLDEHVLAIAKRIDAEHERVRAESIIDMTDEAMAEHGWLRLPKGADGEPIHIGDVMEWPDGETFEVIGIGDDLLFYVEGNDDVIADWTIASTKHHHGATVEDVLRDYASRILIADCIDDEDKLVAEYAAKLRLSGEGE